MNEKFFDKLKEAEKILQTADHMAYVSFPLIKDKNLLIKILSQTKIAITICINLILQYEYLYKRIKLYKDPKSNLKTFEEKCSLRYEISKEEINLIKELFEINERHKKSQMEFIRHEKIVIMSENLETKSIAIDKIKTFIALAKNILKKTKTNILR